MSGHFITAIRHVGLTSSTSTESKRQCFVQLRRNSVPRPKFHQITPVRTVRLAGDNPRRLGPQPLPLAVGEVNFLAMTYHLMLVR